MPGHQCGGCCAGHSSIDDSPEMGIEYSLFMKIDKDNLTCLNEKRDGSAKDIFKPWEERLTMNTVSVDSFCVPLKELFDALIDCRLSKVMWMKNCYSTFRKLVLSHRLSMSMAFLLFYLQIHGERKIEGNHNRGT